MTNANKEKIRRAISRVAGREIDEIFPEAFMDSKCGSIVTAVNDTSPTPHTKIAFVTTGGELVMVRAFGHN
jgi:hypothetical protein